MVPVCVQQYQVNRIPASYLRHKIRDRNDQLISDQVYLVIGQCFRAVLKQSPVRPCTGIGQDDVRGNRVLHRIGIEGAAYLPCLVVKLLYMNDRRHQVLCQGQLDILIDGYRAILNDICHLTAASFLRRFLTPGILFIATIVASATGSIPAWIIIS